MFRKAPHIDLLAAAKVALLLAALFLVSGASGQNSSDLKKKRSNLQKKIEYTNKLISETRNNQRISQTELILINQRIALREEKISTINREIGKLSVQIAELQSVIESMEEDLRILKERYAQLVVFAYKNRDRYDRLLMVFAASDFSVAYARMRYMQEYAEARHKQLVAIRIYQDLLADEIAELEGKKVERGELISLEEADKVALSEDKEQQQQTLGKLMVEEGKLRTKLKKQEREKEKLNQAIAYAIKKEIEAERAKNKGKFELTPAARLISSNFEKNKGRLPWPVDRGLITSTFGEHPHPSIPGLKVKNNGVDISTNKGSEVLAVFEGEVISVIVISGAGKTVMIKHGGYYTTYSNLREVYVAKGDKIKTKQKIGVLLTDNESKTVAHFEIWKVSNDGTLSKQNPSEWIVKR